MAQQWRALVSLARNPFQFPALESSQPPVVPVPGDPTVATEDMYILMVHICTLRYLYI